MASGQKANSAPFPNRARGVCSRARTCASEHPADCLLAPAMCARVRRCMWRWRSHARRPPAPPLSAEPCRHLCLRAPPPPPNHRRVASSVVCSAVGFAMVGKGSADNCHGTAPISAHGRSSPRPAIARTAASSSNTGMEDRRSQNKITCASRASCSAPKYGWAAVRVERTRRDATSAVVLGAARRRPRRRSHSKNAPTKQHLRWNGSRHTARAAMRSRETMP